MSLVDGSGSVAIVGESGVATVVKTERQLMVRSNQDGFVPYFGSLLSCSLCLNNNNNNTGPQLFVNSEQLDR